jgi:hypothetical protein
MKKAVVKFRVGIRKMILEISRKIDIDLPVYSKEKLKMVTVDYFLTNDLKAI